MSIPEFQPAPGTRVVAGDGAQPGTNPYATDVVAQPDPHGPEHAMRRSRPLKHILIWLIVLIVLVAGGIGAYAASNALAQFRWTNHIADGDTVGVLKIPRFGDDFAVPIIEGSNLAALRQGVAWYDETAAPGQAGNFALAGHSFGWGHPFENLKNLRVGDQIIIETSTATYTYTIITGPTTVNDKETDVLSSVPGAPGRPPTKALITLTTAEDILPSPDRLVVVGELG